MSESTDRPAGRMAQIHSQVGSVRLWSLVLTGAHLWCSVVLTRAHSWCPLVLSGAHSCSCTGAHHCPLVFSGAQWCSLVLSGVHWCSRVLTGAHSWCALVFTGAHLWCSLVVFTRGAHSWCSLVLPTCTPLHLPSAWCCFLQAAGSPTRSILV